MKPIISVQYLRAIAAILVVIFHHANAIEAVYAPGSWTLPAGAFGVDIFFVISGFIMWTIASAKPTTPAKFMQRRIIRIVPLYWAITMLTAFVSTSQGVGLDLTPDFGRLFHSLFFLPQWSAEYPSLVAPTLLVGWTLNLEMLFYAIFAGALFLPERYRLASLCIILFAMASARLFIGVSDHPAINLYSESIIAEFAFGILLGWAYMNGLSNFIARQSRWVFGLVFILLGFGVLAIENEQLFTRAIYWGMPAFFIVLGTLFLEPLIARRPIRLFKFLGDASYSIYLVHLMAMALGQKFIGAKIAAQMPMTALICEVLFATAVGCIVHIVMEKPMTRIAKAVFSVNPRTAFDKFRARQW